MKESILPWVLLFQPASYTQSSALINSSGVMWVRSGRASSGFWCARHLDRERNEAILVGIAGLGARRKRERSLIRSCAAADAGGAGGGMRLHQSKRSLILDCSSWLVVMHRSLFYRISVPPNLPLQASIFSVLRKNCLPSPFFPPFYFRSGTCTPAVMDMW